MEDQEKLSPEQSLRLIQQTIELAKRRVQENGFHLLLWGTLVVIAGLADFYFDIIYQQQHPHWPWMIMPVVGVPVALLYEMRRAKTIEQQNTVHQWYGYIWLGYGITLPLLVVYAFQVDASPTALIMALTGFALFMSGIVLQFRPVVLGAIALWGGALACLLVPSLWHSLIMALCTALGYLVPGYLLHRSKIN
jgi:FtsH-binding integral membrane protein